MTRPGQIPLNSKPHVSRQCRDNYGKAQMRAGNVQPDWLSNTGFDCCRSLAKPAERHRAPAAVETRRAATCETRRCCSSAGILLRIDAHAPDAGWSVCHQSQPALVGPVPTPLPTTVLPLTVHPPGTRCVTGPGFPVCERLSGIHTTKGQVEIGVVENLIVLECDVI